MIMIGIHFRTIYPNLLLGLKYGKCFSIPAIVVRHIGKSQKKHPYYMNNQQLEEVTQEKDLGILINNDLKVSKQCQSTRSKATRILGIINRVFRHPDIMLRLQVTGQTTS